MNKKKTLIEFSITPIGESEHLSDQVARCTRLVRESGIKNELHSMGTVLEGDIEDSLKLVRRCLEEVLRDAPRATATIKIDARADGSAAMEKSVESVERKV